jgi:hypothetical protein
MTDPDPDANQNEESTRQQRLKILREYILEAVINSHAGLKSCWTVIFAGGTFNFILSLDKLGECSRLFHQPVFETCQFGTLSHLDLITVAVMHIAYVLTFVRFYVGGIRVFDIKYNELFKFANKITESSSRNAIYKAVLEFSDRSIWKAEVFFLTVQSLFLISLTFHLGDVRDYVINYSVLLIMNSCWLVIGKRSSTPVTSSLFFSEFPELRHIPSLKIMFPRRALGTWAWNNVPTAVILCLAWGALQRGSIFLICGRDVTPFLLLACAALTVLNSVIDFSLTWSFYFPQFAKAYAQLEESSQNIAAHL